MNDNITQLTDVSFESVAIKNRELPVLVDFWAEWCGPCKAMASVIDEIAAEYQDRLVVAKCDIDENSETASKYHIRSIPTLILFKNGSVVATKVGSLSKGELQRFLDGLL